MTKGFVEPPMVEVRSSNVKRVGYDEVKEELYVEFIHKDHFGHPNRNMDGDMYRYYKVPKAIYDRLMSSASKGTYVWEHIRGRYRYMMKGRVGWRGPSNRVESRARTMVASKRKKRKN